MGFCEHGDEPSGSIKKGYFLISWHSALQIIFCTTEQVSINIWWSVKAMKLLIMQSSPVSRHFLPLRSKYSHRPALKQLQSMFFLQCDRLRITSIQKKGKIMVLCILIFKFFWEETGRQKIKLSFSLTNYFLSFLPPSLLLSQSPYIFHRLCLKIRQVKRSLCLIKHHTMKTYGWSKN
jgi:hypothetical protein